MNCTHFLFVHPLHQIQLEDHIIFKDLIWQKNIILLFKNKMLITYLY